VRRGRRSRVWYYHYYCYSYYCCCCCYYYYYYYYLELCKRSPRIGERSRWWTLWLDLIALSIPLCWFNGIRGGVSGGTTTTTTTTFTTT